MRYANIIRELCCSPWAIDVGAYQVIWNLIAEQFDGQLSPEAVDNGLWRSRREFAMRGNVAEIHVLGTLARGLTSLEKTCGNTAYEDLHAEIDRAEAEAAEAIVFNFDSLGGHMQGLFEVAKRIRQSSIPSVAYSDGCCCSAAYLLAAACDTIIAAPSAEVGSIGVIISLDTPNANLDELTGITRVVITNREATLKTIGYVPLTDEHREHLEQRAQEKFEAFKGFVTVLRDIPEDAMKGQSMDAAKAIFADLVDEIGDYGLALERARELAEIASIGLD